VVEEIAESMADSLKVCKVNVDENPVSAQTYGIRAIPTLIVFSGGKEAARMVGVKPKDEIEREIRAAIK
jgi:thioredoxin-like negative regulator of GroEL